MKYQGVLWRLYKKLVQYIIPAHSHLRLLLFQIMFIPKTSHQTHHPGPGRKKCPCPAHPRAVRKQGEFTLYCGGKP